MTGQRDEAARAAQVLRALEERLAVYGGTAAGEKRRLLAELGALPLDRAKLLVALQRAVCFLSAFPDDAAVHRAARRLSEGFAARVARLQKADRDHWRSIIAELKRLRGQGLLVPEGQPV